MPTLKYELESPFLIKKVMMGILREKVNNLICLKFDMHYLVKQCPVPDAKDIEQVISDERNIIIPEMMGEIKVREDKLEEERTKVKDTKIKADILALEQSLADTKKLLKEHQAKVDACEGWKNECLNAIDRIARAEAFISEIQNIVKNPKQLYE